MLLQEALERLDHNKRPDQHATGGTGEPWYTRRAIELLDDLLRPDFTAWEWGSGSSTIWIGRRVGNLTSVEHHPVWVGWVQETIELADLANKVTLLDRPLGKGYAEAINSCEDGSLDAVFIDGRERVACIQNAVPKLKSGGVLTIDNSEREHYGPGGMDLMSGWPMTETKNEKWKTTIWVKP